MSAAISRTRIRRAGVIAVAGSAAVGLLLVPVGAASAASTQSATTVVNATASGSMVSFGSGTYVFSDFTTNSVGLSLKGKSGLAGTSESGTVIEMTAHSSTKAGSVPTATGSSNPLYLMSTSSGSPTLKNFTLLGTSQGHLYNGLRLLSSTNGTVSNVAVDSIPGSGHVPPQETFGINDSESSGDTYSNVTVNGGGVGASGFSSNSSSNVTLSNCTFTDNPYSAGAAFWQTDNITATNVSSTDNRTGINLERDSGTIKIVSPNVTGSTSQDFYIGSDQSNASITISDPVYSHSQLYIRLPTTYGKGANKQLKSSIHVLVNGVDKTSTVVKWLT